MSTTTTRRSFKKIWNKVGKETKDKLTQAYFNMGHTFSLMYHDKNGNTLNIPEDRVAMIENVFTEDGYSDIWD